jgi:hypothetical protein
MTDVPHACVQKISAMPFKIGGLMDKLKARGNQDPVKRFAAVDVSD